MDHPGGTRTRGRAGGADQPVHAAAGQGYGGRDMTTELALPEPQAVALADVRAIIIPAVRGIREEIRAAQDMGAAQELVRRLEAFRRYLTDRETRDLVAAESRRTEVLIGVLLGPGDYMRGKRTDLSPASDKSSVPRMDRVRF